MTTAHRVLAAVLLTALGLPAPQAGADVGPGGFVSSNVDWVATIPLDAPAIGARVVTVGGQRRFYLTGVKGLSIYNVTNPALPVLLGALPLPHFENESVAVSDDGSLVLITSDSFSFNQPPIIYVIDTSTVTVPRIASVIPLVGSHTVTCIDPTCTYLYTSEGATFDLSNRAAPVQVFPGWGDVVMAQGGPRRGHYIGRDAAGLLVVDATPRAVLDPRADPEQPTLLTLAGPMYVASGVAHNSVRPNALSWSPRGGTSLPLNPGELLITSGESLTTPCGIGAGIATWNMAGFNNGVPMTPLKIFRPRSGVYLDGYAPAGALGCSSHWFDYRSGILAVDWYESGLHFFRINEQTGDITEVGYFQPVVTEAWAAYWITDEYVYSVDGVRGIDILRFDRSAPVPAPSDTAVGWDAPTPPLSAAAQRERYVCRLAATR